MKTFLAIVASTALLTTGVRAAVSVDGTLDAGYGSPLAIQTINTGFGDSTVGDGTSTGGSELDAGYGTIQGGTLYLFLSGNFEANGNHINIFLADGRAGQGTLNIGGGTFSTMNGSIFSPGFSATYGLDLNDYQGTLYIDYADLVGNTTGYLGSVPLTGGVGSGTLGGIQFGLNNKNAAGVNGSAGAANASAAAAVNTGLELAIPLSLLGNPSSDVKVLADINGGGDSYLSNQFLPGLAVGTGNVGGGGPYTGPSAGTFNFGSTPGEYFTVPVPEPSSIALFGLAAIAFGLRARKH